MSHPMHSSERTSDYTSPGGSRGLLLNLAILVGDARKKFDTDHEVAKALLFRATSLLRVEIERRSAGPAQDEKLGGLVRWQTRRLNVFIEEHLDRSLLLKELSAVSKLSTGHFSRAFKRTFGETPHSYVMRRRLEKAKSLMLVSDLSLCDIALRCGFADQAHLCKLFRREYAQTPAIWRRERTESVGRKAEGGERPKAYPHIDL